MKKWIVCLFIGLAMLSFGSGVGINDGVRCDGERMLPGDVCETRNRGGDVTSTETYDEVKADSEAAQRTFDSWGQWALLGGGLALTGLAVWGIVRQRRRQKAQGPTTADLHFQQQAAHSGAGQAHPAHPPQQPSHPPQTGTYPQPPQPGAYPQQGAYPQYPPQAGPHQQPPQWGPPVPPPPGNHSGFGPGHH